MPHPPMPPRTRNLHAGYSRRVSGAARPQIAKLAERPRESFATIPLNAVGVACSFTSIFRGRQFDPSAAVGRASALAQHAVALFYTAAVARYHFLAWFLLHAGGHGLAATAAAAFRCSGAIRRRNSSSPNPLCHRLCILAHAAAKSIGMSKKPTGHRQRPHQLWRPRLLAVFARPSRSRSGYSRPMLREVGCRHRLYAVRLQQLPPALPGPEASVERGVLASRRAPDELSDDLARRRSSSSDHRLKNSAT